jgi:hypothetical protein
MVNRVTSRRLFGVLGSAVAWSLHLLASYAVVTVGCSTQWKGTALALAALTIGCAVVSAGAGVVAWRDRSRTEPTVRLLGTIGVGLALLFLGVIALGGTVPVMVPLC